MPGVVNHAGYDAAATLNSQFVQVMVGAYYDSNAIPARTDFSYWVAKGIAGLPNPPVPEEDRLPVALELALRRPLASVGPPHVSTDPQSGATVTRNMVNLDLEFVGVARMRKQDVREGPLTETVSYRLTLYLQVPLVPQRDQGRLMLPLRFDLLRERARRSLELGPRGDADWVARGSLREEAVLAVMVGLRQLPQFDITPSLLNDIDAVAVDPGMTVRTVGNLLVLGIDGFSVEGGPVSRGRPDDLRPFLNQGAVAVSVDPAHVDRALAKGLAALKDDQNADVEALLSNERIDRLSHRLGAEHVRLAGKVTDLRRKIRVRDGALKVVDDKANRALEFSFRGTLGVNREAGRIETQVSHLAVSLDLSGIEALFVPGAMTVLLASGLYTRLLGMAGDLVGDEIDDALAGFGIYQLPIGANRREVLRLAYREACLGEAGALAMGDVTRPRVKLQLEPVGALGEIYITQAHQLTIRARMVQGYVAEDDPDLVVEWEVMRMSRDHDWSDWVPVLPAMTTRRVAWRGIGDMRFALELPAGAQGFRVRARLLREGLAGAEVLGEGEVVLPTVDRLDRSRPMVAWSYIFHEPRVHRFRSRNGTGMEVVDYSRRKKRFSKIHLTAYPGRCKHADRFSARRSLHLWYLEDYQLWPPGLRRSERRLEMIRDRLCPYCFFGGPAGTHLQVAPGVLGL